MTMSPPQRRLRPPGPNYPLGYGDPTPFVRNRLRVLRDLASTYGDCCRFRLGFHEVYLLTHPDLVRRLVVSEASKVGRSAVTQLTRLVLGGSVFNASGEATSNSASV
jgi:hypothetical protein